MNPAFLRLFIAIQVPKSVRNEMFCVQKELRPLATPEDVRWVNSEQFHLTLKFLGNVPENSVAAIKQSLAEVCADVRPFKLRAEGIGFFPNTRSPRVIWAGIEARNPLLDLQAHLAKSLAPFTENAIAEKFLAHVTLGRFQKYRRHKTKKLFARALALGAHFFGEWRVESVDLMRSELSPAGARQVVS
ncbi:MAG TPA: RNA 2',3'-cyclic phosphodiesterase [Verrucomicrobiae bacterium]|nr:RNA 2',3'-cyclic phosphodiesterase [Verrucomicrobiae bacterium]